MFSKDHVLTIAQHVSKPNPCEWEGCRVVLNCWNNLSKHLHQHCAEVQIKEDAYECGYSRCAGRLHSAISELKNHINQSHLSRISLYCPVRDCNEAFPRPALLTSHFDTYHHNLFGVPLSCAYIHFSPTACPTRRKPFPPAPPPLLSNSFSAVPLCVTTLSRRRHDNPSSGELIGRKWSRMEVQDEDGEDDRHIAFSDLRHPQVPCHSSPESIDVVVRKALPGATERLARPQPMEQPPVRDVVPRETMLYCTFYRKVEQLMSDGVL
ncbi:hypothetical protein BV22DRAFT_1063046 [Leucogyrophana mollusca]|uniref:Uncharacterized protein n=1 Tax=Leucogyrophana mollusca TaxID=85980 RepID=A0ACB8BKT9_9AGAM|nr:hypothetical protein BV22DRAFT_1063046 [Leucogyrophana mollusca]